MTTAPEPEVILEPGDPGYVDPNAPPPEEAPLVAEEVPPPQDLTHVQQPGESDAEFMQRTRTTVVDSQSPLDIVPNQPQIVMSNQEPTPEEPPPDETEPEAEPEATA